MPFSPTLKRTDAEILARLRTLQTPSDVADLLEIPSAYLFRVLYKRRERLKYRTFSIPKRTGGRRIIKAPPPSLKVLQEKVNHIFQLVYKPKPCVHGFCRGRSIASNAAVHSGKRWILNVDLQDFFPEINFGRVRGVLKKHPFNIPDAAATVLAQICTDETALPQGAPSSPVLANMVCARLDGEMMRLAKTWRLVYTRYCDDITLSSRAFSFPQEIASASAGWTAGNVTLGTALTDVVTRNGFRFNSTKTRLQFRTGHQEVTGLTVNVFPNVSRDFVRQLRALLYSWRKHGLNDAADYYGRLVGNQAGRVTPERFQSIVCGKLQYVGMIRGWSDPVYCTLRRILYSIDASLIGPLPTPGAYRVPVVGRGGDKWTRLFMRVQQSVLHLTAQLHNGDSVSGTAFASDRGHFATAAHNLGGSTQVDLHGPGQVWSLSEARSHSRGVTEIDCALLPSNHGLAPLVSSARIPAPGEEVAIIGFASVPRRQPGVGLYVGTVESLRMDYSNTTQFIHVSVASGGGLSGAPLLDIHGRVLGIVVESVFETTQAAVPHREYCTVLPVHYIREVDPSSSTSTLPVVS